MLAIVLVALVQRQAIRDWAQLYNYTPPASVVELADEISATDKARRLFYINHPAIEDRDSFNSSCSRSGEHTIVLGCYHPVDRGIFIFHVADDRLNGVDQVTAGHEMLHAAYDRLDTKERHRVNTMLQNFYAEGPYDERIKTIIAAYQKSEPDDVVNEMHSIFATEVSILPSDLEVYYKQYFKDRAKVVAYASSYQAEFASRQKQVADYDSQLKSMKEQIDKNSESLEREEKEISAFRSQMEADRAGGNIQRYNNNVPVFNARIDTYNGLITQTRQLITRYNNLVATRNQLALQVTELAHSIDSSFEPLQAQ